MTTTTPTYYEILGISSSVLAGQDDDQAANQLIKRAYRRALLSHHPDKKNSTSAPKSLSGPSSFSIDQISTAYAVLSSPSQRTTYDRLLLTTTTTTSSATSSACRANARSQFQTGIEPVDLDDLAYDEDSTQWFRECRCGNVRGFRFGEDDLEDAADLGELMVGCADCSLWLRVQFSVVVESDGEGAGIGEEGDDSRNADSEMLRSKNPR